MARLIPNFKANICIAFLLGCVITITFVKIPYLMRNPKAFGSRSNKKLAVIFGDSISQHGFDPKNSGWVACLSNYWTRKVDVINRGFSGYNSRWGLSVVYEAVISLNPDLVVIFFGANDAVIPEGATHVPIKEYTQNLENIILAIKKNVPGCNIILITPPPIAENLLEQSNIMKGKRIHLDRTNDRTLSYANACVFLGVKFDLPVLNAWKGLNGDLPSREDYLIDGLHLNAKGNEKVFELFKSLIQTSLPSWKNTILSMYLPEWSELVG